MLVLSSYLTNRFHVAVRLLSNRSQMASKCGKNKKVALMFLPHFDVLCDLLLNRRTAATWNLFVLYNKEKNYYSNFIAKSFPITRKPAFAHFGKHEKKPFDVICCLYKMKQSHWLLCVTRNCDWSKKITSLSNLTQMASRRIKPYSESRIELRNLQMLRKCWKNRSVFVIREAF